MSLLQSALFGGMIGLTIGVLRLLWRHFFQCRCAAQSLYWQHVAKVSVLAKDEAGHYYIKREYCAECGKDLTQERLEFLKSQSSTVT